MTLLLGLDPATLEKKAGMACGWFDGSRLQVEAVLLGSDAAPVEKTLAEWTTGSLSQSCAIEVYPAATLLAHGFVPSGYKGVNGARINTSN